MSALGRTTSSTYELIIGTCLLGAWLIHLVLRGARRSQADGLITQARRRAHEDWERTQEALPKRYAGRCELCDYSWEWGHGLPDRQVRHRPDLIETGQRRKMLRMLESQTKQLQVQGAQLHAQSRELERQRNMVLLGILALWDKRHQR
jgi:hypothetical protein